MDLYQELADLEPGDGVYIISLDEEEKAMAEAVGAIVIDTVENDDWMKTLPGYQDEAAIHKKLAEQLRKSNQKSIKIPIKVKVLQ